MGRSIQEFVDETAMVSGFIVPVFETDDVGGEHMAALSPADAAMVLDGYACGNSRCRAIYGGIYRVVCPVCHFDRRTQTPDRFMVPVPDMWAQHIRDREAALENPDPQPKRLPSMEQAILGVRNNPDVEQVTLKQLGPSKWGRGRT